MDFVSAKKAAHFLFFFGVPSAAMLEHEPHVTLQISFEAAPFFYERLDATKLDNKPDIVEIGFRAPETFLFRNRAGSVQPGRLEENCRQFFEQVIEREF